MQARWGRAWRIADHRHKLSVALTILLTLRGARMKNLLAVVCLLCLGGLSLADDKSSPTGTWKYKTNANRSGRGRTFARTAPRFAGFALTARIAIKATVTRILRRVKKDRTLQLFHIGLGGLGLLVDSLGRPGDIPDFVLAPVKIVIVAAEQPRKAFHGGEPEQGKDQAEGLL